MHLIDVGWFKTHGDVRLRHFHNPPDEGYAILSHTWVTDEGEVSLSDLMDPQEAAKKPGFVKIVYTCTQAWSDGHEWVWIDTCCIDKRSSSELTEAINSMYKWYELAAVCYVYLADLRGDCPRLVETRTHKVITAELVGCDTRGAKSSVLPGLIRSTPVQADLPPMDNEERAGSHQEDWVLRFAKCRWFRRGWTLQELIAPKQLVFFGTDWNFIGSKLDLLYTLSDITGIDSIALSHRCKLEELSIAKRLSWAAQRTTTRIEDTAYSLLGLLNINMSLLYGEGERAFTRLQEEIIRKSADSSVFAWFRGMENGLLAPSPALYWTGRRIILCNGATVTHSFELTHRGLKMRLPVLKQGWIGEDEILLGVLSCCIEDDFERVLCLHLKEQMADPTDSGETTVCSIEKCTPKCAKSQALDWNVNRLHFINSRRVRLAEYRTVLLPRHNFQSHASTSVLTMMSSLWIKKLPLSLEVVEVFPARQWNIETRVMSKYRNLPWNNLIQCGGVLLKHTSNGTVAVCFLIEPGREFIKVLNGSQMPLQQICKGLESSSHTVQRRAVHHFRALNFSSQLRLEATLKLDIYMGEQVWCVELHQVQTDI